MYASVCANVSRTEAVTGRVLKSSKQKQNKMKKKSECPERARSNGHLNDRSDVGRAVLEVTETSDALPSALLVDEGAILAFVSAAGQRVALGALVPAATTHLANVPSAAV